MAHRIKLVSLLAALVALALMAFLLTRDGSGCRAPDDGDDDMEPACKPGDKECHGAAPEPSPG
jgi:hypothetical protein